MDSSHVARPENVSALLWAPFFPTQEHGDRKLVFCKSRPAPLHLPTGSNNTALIISAELGVHGT
jgi:hypothetical protein